MDALRETPLGPPPLAVAEIGSRMSPSEGEDRTAGAQRDVWLAMSDQELRRTCLEDFYRAGGPGGQKRNKTESAVRLRHPPTGLSVIASESRLREENRRRALRRLREALAFRVRRTLADGEVPEPVRLAAANALLRVAPRSPQFLPLAAALLDLLDARRARLAEAAAPAGVSTAALVKFLRAAPALWEAAQRLRAKHGQPPLR